MLDVAGMACLVFLGAKVTITSVSEHDKASITSIPHTLSFSFLCISLLSFIILFYILNMSLKPL